MSCGFIVGLFRSYPVLRPSLTLLQPQMTLATAEGSAVSAFADAAGKLALSPFDLLSLPHALTRRLDHFTAWPGGDLCTVLSRPESSERKTCRRWQCRTCAREKPTQRCLSFPSSRAPLTTMLRWRQSMFLRCRPSKTCLKHPSGSNMAACASSFRFCRISS